MSAADVLTDTPSPHYQAEAYAHTLKAFFAAFPEYKTNPLYFTGEVCEVIGYKPCRCTLMVDCGADARFLFMWRDA